MRYIAAITNTAGRGEIERCVYVCHVNKLVAHVQDVLGE